MKIKVKLIFPALAILITFLFSCSKQIQQQTYNDRVVVLCNKLTNIMNNYSACFADIIEKQDLPKLKEISLNSQNELDLLYVQLNAIKVSKNNRVFQDKIIHYFELSEKLINIGTDLSAYDYLYEKKSVQLLRDYTNIYQDYKLAINDVITYQEEFAKQHKLLITQIN